MASGKILSQLIKAGASGDSAGFRRASEAVITEERQKQHHLLANDLEQILYGGNLQPASRGLTGILPKVPADKERGLPLLDIRQPRRAIEEIILPQESMLAIEELLETARSSRLWKNR